MPNSSRAKPTPSSAQQPVGKITLLQLGGVDIDADLDVQALPAPGLDLGQGGADHLLADLDAERVLFHHR